MPFTIQKDKKGKFCVYKKDADGNAMGDTLGCHKLKKDAVAQIGAVESELKRRGKKSSEVDFVLIPTWKTYSGDNTTSFADNTTSILVDTTTGNIIYDGEIINEEISEDMSDLDTDKAYSIDDYRTMVYDAWGEGKGIADSWVTEIFDEFVIVYDYTNKSYYKIPYDVVDDAVEFVQQPEWQEVKLKKEWVEKSLDFYTRFSFEDFYLTEEEEEETEPEPVKESKFAIKTLGGNRVGGYAVLWGDEDSKDLDDEFFTPDTKDLTHIFESVGVVPFVVHHAADEKVVKFVAGAVDIMEADDTGLWWEAKVKEFEAYKKYVMPMMEKGMAFVSSGTLPRAKRTEKNGFIARWPIAEISATWLPAEYRMLEHPIAEVKSAYEQLGIEADLSAYDDTNQSSDTDTADQGVEKARLKELVEQELVKFNLLQIELGE